MKISSAKSSILLGVLQVIFFVLFTIFVRYSPDADSKYHPVSSNTTVEEMRKLHLEAGSGDKHVATYPFFQDVHVMIFIGFGFLMTFLKRYGFSAVGLNFLVAATSLEWGILVNGFFHLHEGTIFIDLNSLLSADFVAAAVLISYGAVLGKTTPTQLILMALIEIPIFAINEVIGRKYFGAIDMGDSMFVHAFGAYFGLAVSFMIRRPDVSTEKEGSSYQSDIFAMIGTIFLWLYWPSFNSGAAPGDDQHRAIINTYLALCSSCVASFVISALVNSERKFDMVHIQNSTLAGGVAIGTSADLMIEPWGAILVGVIAGAISVLGYVYVTPLINEKLKIHDTCGVHNLHGMPGVLAGIIGAILAGVAMETEYGFSLYEIFPARTPIEGSPDLRRIKSILPDLEAGPGISAGSQALYQLLALLLSLGFAIGGGLVCGFILNLRYLSELDRSDLYDDAKYWLLEDSHDSVSEVQDISIKPKTSTTEFEIESMP